MIVPLAQGVKVAGCVAILNSWGYALGVSSSDPLGQSSLLSEQYTNSSKWLPDLLPEN